MNIYRYIYTEVHIRRLRVDYCEGGHILYIYGHRKGVSLNHVHIKDLCAVIVDNDF